MKNFKMYLVLTVLILLLTISFAACSNEEKVYDLEGSVTIVLVNTITNDEAKSYEVDLKEAQIKSNDSLLVLIDYLSTLYKINDDYSYTYEDNYLSYSISNGFVKSVGSLVPDNSAANYQYVSLFTSVEADKDVSDFAADPIDYKGTTLYYSGLGIGQMQLVSGAVYSFRLVEYIVG